MGSESLLGNLGMQEVGSALRQVLLQLLLLGLGLSDGGLQLGLLVLGRGDGRRQVGASDAASFQKFKFWKKWAQPQGDLSCQRAF